jgi:hypothetical protein
MVRKLRLAPYPDQSTSRLKPSEGLEKNIFTSGLHRAPPREKKANNAQLNAEPKQQQ